MARSILNNIGTTGQGMRKIYQRRLPTNPNLDYYYILRDTANNESLIVEYGFIDNDKDLQFFMDNYRKLGEAVIKSILEYKNIEYVSPDDMDEDIYVVQSGDTLYGIADKFDTTVKDLKILNNLSSDILSIGQILKIPNTITSEDKNDIYQVKAGDTLYSIANKYNISVSEIIKLNKLDNNNLSIGQLLKLPIGSSLQNYYIVSKGDTLYSIAKMYNTPVSTLKELNNLSSNMLVVGQKLLIPFKDETTYVVKSGDTLYSISKKFSVPISTLKDLNKISNDNLSIGQILILK